MKHKSTFDGRKGFTLIELLVVIGIIAVLAAILFPVFARARENARRASCLSNLKQIGLAIMQYTQDYDERYPNWVEFGNSCSATADVGKPCRQFSVKPENAPAPDGSGASVAWGDGNKKTWMDFIYPYTKSTQVFICPSSAVQTYPSYGYNAGISRGKVGASFNEKTAPNIPFSMAQVTRPSEIVMIFDDNTLYSVYASPRSVQQDMADSRRDSVIPHLEGTNIAYADGHAKWTPAAKLDAMANKTAAACTSTDIAAGNDSKIYCDRGWNPEMP